MKNSTKGLSTFGEDLNVNPGFFYARHLLRYTLLYTQDILEYDGDGVGPRLVGEQFRREQGTCDAFAAIVHRKAVGREDVKNINIGYRFSCSPTATSNSAKTGS